MTQDPKYHKKKILQEMRNLEKNSLDGVNINWTSKDTPEQLELTFQGPKDSLYKGETFKVLLTFDESYPANPPKAEMLTKVIHPNFKGKEICIHALRNGYRPDVTIPQIISEICYSLSNPNPDDPLSPEVAELYKNDFTQYKIKVQEQISENLKSKII